MRTASVLTVTEEEQALLNGSDGPGVSLAMRLVTATADVMRARRLLRVSGAHIDSCVYYGQAGLDFAERLVALGGRVRVPTTLNIGLLDLMHPELVTLDAVTTDAARRLMQAYVTMGAAATFTCAPYQLPASRPRLGEQVAWAESNAIVFANSVLGARTNRYGDFIDIAAAICGRVPDAGLHRAEHRRGQVLVDTVGVGARLRRHDAFCALLGLVVGTFAGAEIPVITGLDPATDEDALKALGAAAASSGAVALFHAVGVTPEAATLRDAFGGRRPSRRLSVDTAMLRHARDELGSVGAGAALDAVCVGTPHASLSELRRIAAALNGRQVRVPLLVHTGRGVLALAEAAGVTTALRDAGVTILVDTCTYVSPIVAAVRGVVMTSSAKWAYYAPGNIGVGVAFGSLEECVGSAQRGVVWRDDDAWT